MSDETYREYVRGELLVEAYRDHFVDEVVGASAEQRRVAQIVIQAVTGTIVPQERARHILIDPLPEDAAQDAVATDEQWADALAEAAGGTRPAGRRERRLVRDRRGAK